MTVIADHPRRPDEASSCSTLVLRPYRAQDRADVREICCRTAFRNLGCSALVDDPELFADYWSAYYTDYEPEATLIAERDGVIVGYLMGCLDTRRFRRVMARQIVPRVIGRLVARAARGRYRGQPRAARFLRWLAVRSWREEPEIDVTAYPAHYHANLGREGHGHLLYSTMALHFLDQLDEYGVSHVHGQVLDYETNGTWERMVSAIEKQNGKVRLRRWERRSTLGEDVLGTRPLINRAFGGTVQESRTVLLGLASRFRV
jgi:hypothetical protein